MTGNDDTAPRACRCTCDCGCHEGMYLLEHTPRQQVRGVLRANLFDGEEGGLLTQSITGLLNEMVEVLCGPGPECDEPGCTAPAGGEMAYCGPHLDAHRQRLAGWPAP